MGVLRVLVGVTVAVLGVSTAASCGALLDIDIEFGDPATGGDEATGGGGDDASGGAGGGTGGQGVGGDGGTLLVECGEGMVCAPAVPPTFSGPVAVFPAATGCGVAWPSSVATGGAQIDDAGAGCSNCGCSTSSGAICGIGTVNFYSANDCNGGVQPRTPTQVGVCAAVSGLGGVDSASGVPVPLVAPGSCMASVAVFSAPQPAFTSPVEVCTGAIAVDGCDGGATCVPAPSDGGVCVAIDGIQACPPEYPTGTTLYRGLDDQRGCAACQCGVAAGEVCHGETHTYSLPGCVDPIATVAHSVASCEDLNNVVPESIVFTANATSPGTCPPSGGAVTGAVVGTNPLTVCCVD